MGEKWEEICDVGGKAEEWSHVEGNEGSNRGEELGRGSAIMDALGGGGNKEGLRYKGF
jgi:hypothetical protein